MQTYIYGPLTELLINIYKYTNDIGWTIVLLTIVVKLLLLPLNVKAAVDGEKTQRIMKRLKPELEKIKNKFKNDRTAELIATQELYKSEKFNPFTMLLSLLIIILQLPILIGLYHVITRIGIAEINTNKIYTAAELINNASNMAMSAINPMAFGSLDVTSKNVWMGILSGFTMYILGSITLKKKANQEGETEMQIAMMKAMRIQMIYVFPIILAFSGTLLPAGIGIYFVIANIFGIGQFYVIEKFKKRLIQIDKSLHL